MLAGELAARAGAAKGRLRQVHDRLVRLRARALAQAPQRPVRRAESRPHGRVALLARGLLAGRLGLGELLLVIGGERLDGAPAADEPGAQLDVPALDVSAQLSER